MSLKHTHQYTRISAKRHRQFRCLHPDCSHWQDATMLAGTRSICNLCGEPFILDPYALTTSKPRCKSCRGLKDGTVKTDKDVAKNLDKLLEGTI